MNIIITGTTGFLGSDLIKRLTIKNSFCITAVSRSKSYSLGNRSVLVSDIDSNTCWKGILDNQQVVVHTAARAHIMKDTVADPLAEYRRINVHGTLNLARQASIAGVKRFIYISSIKVNGEQTHNGQKFKPDDVPAPENAYGISKFEAEQGLLQIASETDIEVVIIRSPLVYGPSVKGNFSRMIEAVKKRIPLPLGAIYNKRSLVSLDNLVDLIVKCLNHKEAANQIFIAGDGCDLSTTQLLRGIAKAYGVSSRLIPVPASVLVFVASFLGKRVLAQRLLGSLQVDISKTRDLLGWTPPLTVEEGLRRCFVDNAERY